MQENGVICAVDINDYDQNLVDVSAGFAKRFGVDLDLVYVTSSSNPSSSNLPVFTLSAAELAKEHQRLLKVGTSISGVKTIHHHLTGIPAKVLLRLVERNCPRLLILGNRKRTGLDRLFGGVVTKLLRKANCPVMVLQPLAKGETEKPRIETNSDVSV